MSGGDTAEEQRPDPSEDPFACSICGQPLGSTSRIEGEDHCDACKREYGVAHAE